jgi:flagellar motility protein MotE (MotC chaperone)
MPRSKTHRLLLLLMLAALSVPALLWSQDPPKPTEPQVASVEERRLNYAIAQERERLLAEYRQKEETLNLREIELKTLAGEVDKKLAELRQLKSELAALVGQKENLQAKRLNDLGKMYEKMEAAQAAELIQELDEGLAVDILARMKSKSVGRLLNHLDSDKAARLSAAYSSLGQP